LTIVDNLLYFAMSAGFFERFRRLWLNATLFEARPVQRRIEESGQAFVTDRAKGPQKRAALRVETVHLGSRRIVTHSE
jgi:hypothetical protein